MAKIEEVRDGLLSISWTTHHLFSATRLLPSSEIMTDYLRNLIYESNCLLICRLQEPNLLVLEMKTIESAGSLLKGVAVTASYGGVKQKMTLSETVWNTTWNWTPLAQCVHCNMGRGQRMSVVTFDILIDFKPDCVLSVKNGSKRILENLEKLWVNKTMSDVAFNCGKEVIKAHTSILASGSPVLAAMFQHNSQESQKRIVLIKDVEAKILKNLLHYLYVGNCELLENREGNGMADLFVAADKYDVESLRKECESHLSNSLSVENAVKFLVLAYLHNAHKLYETALNFIAKNAKAICSQKDWMEVIKSYPELCFQVVKLIAGC